jgi:hypothetical protein
MEQLDNAKQKLINELATLKMTFSIFEIFSLKEESERIRFNCEQEVYNTRLQVKDIIVR